MWYSIRYSILKLPQWYIYTIPWKWGLDMKNHIPCNSFMDLRCRTVNILRTIAGWMKIINHDSFKIEVTLFLNFKIALAEVMGLIVYHTYYGVPFSKLKGHFIYETKGLRAQSNYHGWKFYMVFYTKDFAGICIRPISKRSVWHKFQHLCHSQGP